MIIENKPPVMGAIPHVENITDYEQDALNRLYEVWQAKAIAQSVAHEILSQEKRIERLRYRSTS